MSSGPVTLGHANGYSAQVRPTKAKPWRTVLITSARRYSEVVLVVSSTVVFVAAVAIAALWLLSA